jgi:VanZ family protein
MKLKPVYFHIALIIFLLVIFIQSSIPGDELPEFEYALSDKIIHSVIYAVLFILFFYSLKNQNKSIKLRLFAAEYSLLFTALYGVTDEIHQYFVPNRHSDFFDWLADILGAIAMYIAVKFLYGFKLRIRGENLKSALLIFIPLLFFTGCKSAENINSDIEFKITKAEAWIDLMPKIIDENIRQDDTGKNFHFLIEASAVSKEPLKEEDFLVYNFQVEFSPERAGNNNNSYYRRADFSTLIIDDRNYLILVKDLSYEDYFSYSERVIFPDWVGFTFDIYLKGNKLQTLKTNFIPIDKVH